MDVERLIPLILFFLMWRVVSRVQKKKAPPQLKAAMKKNQAVDALKRLFTGTVSPEDMLDHEAGSMPPPQFKEKTVYRRQGSLSTHAGRLHQETQSAARIEEIVLPVKAAVDNKSRAQKVRFSKVDRKSLQEAVIWAELLAKPLALRNKEWPGAI